MKNNSILSIKDLRISFGAVPVVHGLNLEIEAGKTLALVGESGSGKSVTSLAVMGLLPEATGHAKGSVRLGDTELLGLSENRMRSIRGSQISMIFQEPMTSLNPVQRIGDQLAEVIRLHRGLKGSALREAVLEMLRKVRIPDPETRMKQYPHTFSGGMRQRVMIAMALACNPKLIIADEPTTALDVTVQAQILDLLRELQRETGTAILFITHDMGVVAEMADHVLVMQNGREIERGEVHEIFSNPKDDYTKTLIAAAPSLVGRNRQTDMALQPLQELPLTGAEAGQAEQPVIVVRDLSVRFPVHSGLLSRLTGNVHAVEDVSFAIHKGETLGLVGESGSGKSTIGKAIIDLAPVHAGTVQLCGREIDYKDAKSLSSLHRDVQMIFQDPFGSLNSRQTIGSAIIEPMSVHGLAKGKEAQEKMKWLLERVGLDPRRSGSLPHEFSGGQRQRICIARALAMSPKLIIADEAVSALDVAIKGQIIELMIDLQQEFGVSYLFISHDMAAVEKICDRVAVMYFGEIVEIGTKTDVISNPVHPYTQRLLSAIPVTHPAQRQPRLVSASDREKPRSPLKPLNYTPPEARWARASDGHYIRQSA
ncbi:ABC transporter ATP-binding protein [Pseudochrobactrum sp. sp1633]|uniref:ABC transporter ATP-binding protein n=1 Tax=Pseudochrobactrum sp. sp1633 TaxID=3036706 RepID=UPI0025A50CA8|nr:ABC transporter ATP-binding protein [Pseudochrobactrum sp. sp1633]MDM8347079.1 ABC transporter ATP-binding protein [Pseudochrobactrum sp. sp1633]HWD12608.1 ABC transporter ATP-binding protein [Pseudochrobactrum sp.]